MSEENNNEQEANFNDAELQDIMAEIESLEQEFSEEEELLEEEPVAEANDEPQPEASEEPQEEPVDHSEEEPIDHREEEPVSAEAEPVANEAPEDDGEGVLAFEQTPSEPQPQAQAPHAGPSTESPMSFQGQGTLNFSMNFEVGSEQAQVAVADGRINVSMGDIELVISQEGCFVEMADGVNFSVPLKNKTKQAA